MSPSPKAEFSSFASQESLNSGYHVELEEFQDFLIDTDGDITGDSSEPNDDDEDEESEEENDADQRQSIKCPVSKRSRKHKHKKFFAHAMKQSKLRHMRRLLKSLIDDSGNVKSSVSYPSSSIPPVMCTDQREAPTKATYKEETIQTLSKMCRVFYAHNSSECNAEDYGPRAIIPIGLGLLQDYLNLDVVNQISDSEDTDGGQHTEYSSLSITKPRENVPDKQTALSALDVFPFTPLLEDGLRARQAPYSGSASGKICACGICSECEASMSVLLDTINKPFLANNQHPHKHSHTQEQTEFAAALAEKTACTTSTVSLEQAIGLSSLPRLVAEAHPPYRIIHVNAALGVLCQSLGVMELCDDETANNQNKDDGHLLETVNHNLSVNGGAIYDTANMIGQSLSDFLSIPKAEKLQRSPSDADAFHSSTQGTASAVYPQQPQATFFHQEPCQSFNSTPNSIPVQLCIRRPAFNVAVRTHYIPSENERFRQGSTLNHTLNLEIFSVCSPSSSRNTVETLESIDPIGFPGQPLRTTGTSVSSSSLTLGGCPPSHFLFQFSTKFISRPSAIAW